LEDEDQVAQEFGEVQVVDVDAPHPDFTLATAGKGLGLTEAAEIFSKLRDDLPSTGDIPHPLLRALRRGVGVYVEVRGSLLRYIPPPQKKMIMCSHPFYLHWCTLGAANGVSSCSAGLGSTWQLGCCF